MNCEAWEVGEDNYGCDYVEELMKRFIISLKNAGFAASVADLINQRKDMKAYTIKYLCKEGEDYLVTCRRIFSSQFSSKWWCILLLVELLFCFPISNAKLERLFSAMKRLKTYIRSSLSDCHLEDLVRIVIEGTPTLNFDVIPACESLNHRR